MTSSTVLTRPGALLTVAEAAAELRCSDKHIRRLIGAGQLRAFRIGSSPSSRIRIDRADLRDFLAGEPEEAA